MESMSYDKRSETLTLYARSPENSDFIKIEKVMVSTYTYHPSQTIYTGATSGSVHMGGFHTESEYYSAQSESSGKYRLVYKNSFFGGDYCPIEKIRLADPSLISAAKVSDTVSRFLKGDGTLVLSNEPTSQRDLSYLKYMDTAVAMGAISMLSAERALDKLDCQAIKDWMCTDYNEQYVSELEDIVANPSKYERSLKVDPLSGVVFLFGAFILSAVAFFAVNLEGFWRTWDAWYLLFAGLAVSALGIYAMRSNAELADSDIALEASLELMSIQREVQAQEEWAAQKNEMLQYYQEMLDRGIITQEDFDKKRNMLERS